MSNRILILLASAASILAACENAETPTKITGDTSPIAEQETGKPYIPFPLSVSAIGRVEAAPDIAVVTGLIEIEDKNHDAAYAQIADIINEVQATADTANTEMSYTDISAVDIWDKDCLDENAKASKRHSDIRSALNHNRSTEERINSIEHQKESALENYVTERRKRLGKINKLRANRDIPEFRRDLFNQEEDLETFEANFEASQKTRNAQIENWKKTIRKVEERLPQKTCSVLNVKAKLRFTARINPAERAPEFMNEFTQAGVTKVNLYGYDFSDYDAVYQKAAEKAVENAREKAKLIAERSGTRLKKLQTFSVSQPTRFGRFGPQSQTIVTQPRHVNYVSIPPVFETYTEPVVIQEASTELITIPPTYETVTETVIVQEANSELVTIPATYKTVTETFVVQPEYEYNGQIVPAVTKQVTRRVVDTPARTIERAIPAVTKQEKRRVVKTPASTTERVIPAVTQMVTRRRIKTPARTVEQITPAKTQKLFSDGLDDQSNALRQSVLSGPQMVEATAHLVFDYATALDDVRIRN